MNEQLTKHDHVLMSLVMQLQSNTMVHLGKMSNPMTGEVELDLDSAAHAIDLLEMLQAKCRTDTPEALLKVVDQAVMDLQMNYLDEAKKAAATEKAATVETPEADAPKADAPKADEEKPAEDLQA